MKLPERARKILALALDGAAAEGEWHSAAIKFVSCLRASSISISDFEDVKPTSQPPPRHAKMPFGQYKGEFIRDVPSDYLEYLLTWDKLKDDLRRIIEAELLYRNA